MPFRASQLENLVPNRFSWMDEDPDTQVFAGFWDPTTDWNGWAMPFFPKAEMDRIAADWPNASYDPASDTFTFPHDPEVYGEVEPDLITGIDHPTFGRLYDTACVGWTWSAMDEDA